MSIATAPRRELASRTWPLWSTVARIVVDDPSVLDDATAIADAKVLFIATNGFEQSELFGPRQALLDAGAKVTLASDGTDEIQGMEHDKPGKTIKPVLIMEHDA